MRINGRLRFRLQRLPWMDGVSIFLRNVMVMDGQSIVSRPEPIVMKQITEPELGSVFEPLLQLERDEAQELMDELWYCGIRPSEGTGSAGAFTAVQAHLKDLQRLVFKDKPAKGDQ